MSAMALPARQNDSVYKFREGSMRIVLYSLVMNIMSFRVTVFKLTRVVVFSLCNEGLFLDEKCCSYSIGTFVFDLEGCLAMGSVYLSSISTKTKRDLMQSTD